MTASIIDALPDITEVKALSDADKQCLGEVRQVLDRHQMTRKFGVSLLHKHFSVADDEVLVECCDPEQRTLIIKPVKKETLVGMKQTETNWILGQELSATLYCTQVCLPSKEGHITDHHYTR